MKLKTTHFFLILTALALVLTSGCAKPKPAGLTNEQVTSMTENVLKALEAGDYSKFTQDFSDQMSAAFSQDKFDSLKTMLQTASGKYISLEAPALTNNQGYALYRFPAKYELETVYVTVTFLVGGQKIEGFFLDSSNLRKQPN